MKKRVRLRPKFEVLMSCQGKIFSPVIKGIGLSSLLIATVIGLNPSVKAAEVNFDDGWFISGDVQVESLSQVNLSSDGLFDDDSDLGVSQGKFNFSGNAATIVGFGGLEAFLSVDPAQLDVGGVAFEGSAIKTTLTVNQTSELIFDWDFLTNETSELVLRGPYKDYGFVQIGQKVNKLADYQNTKKSANCSFGFDACTGLKTAIYLLKPGQYFLAFGVIDVDDFAITSALKISNLSLTPSRDQPNPTDIPEPNLIGAILIVAPLATKLLQKH